VYGVGSCWDVVAFLIKEKARRTDCRGRQPRPSNYTNFLATRPEETRGKRRGGAAEAMEGAEEPPPAAHQLVKGSAAKPGPPLPLNLSPQKKGGSWPGQGTGRAARHLAYRN